MTAHSTNIKTSHCYTNSKHFIFKQFYFKFTFTEIPNMILVRIVKIFLQMRYYTNSHLIFTYLIWLYHKHVRSENRERSPPLLLRH